MGNDVEGGGGSGGDGGGKILKYSADIYLDGLGESHARPHSL
jgi:hypothetical protein